MQDREIDLSDLTNSTSHVSGAGNEPQSEDHESFSHNVRA